MVIRTSDFSPVVTSAKTLRPGVAVKWTQEGKAIHSARIKEYWAKKKTRHS